MTVQTALLFDNIMPDNIRTNIEKALENIKGKSLFEHDIALHMGIKEFCHMYL
mgnify:CR=1 FL=1